MGVKQGSALGPFPVSAGCRALQAVDHVEDRQGGFGADLGEHPGRGRQVETDPHPGAHGVGEPGIQHRLVRRQASCEGSTVAVTTVST